MELKIRLARVGRRKQPAYRIVVTKARSARANKALEVIGQYGISFPGSPLKVDVAKYDEWVSKGAQPTERARKLINKYKAANTSDILLQAEELRAPKKKVAPPQEIVEEVKAEAPAEEAKAEAPAEEAKAEAPAEEAKAEAPAEEAKKENK
jgi:small subunit ribosomal protein S16